jgi:hydrogenase-4 component B
MRVAMLLHAAGVCALGLMPFVGLRIVRFPAELFSRLAPSGADQAVADASAMLRPIGQVALVLVVVLGALAVLRWVLTPSTRSERHVTWGCGYTAPNSRMQYTGASFASPFAILFSSVLVHLRRQKLPEGPFPEGAGHLNTHCVDAVERRVFEVLGEGEDLVTRVIARISEEPRLAFGMGLVVLGVVVGFVVGGVR